MPYEAEDLYARALPTYRHIARHRYDLHNTTFGDLPLLMAATAAHLDHFKARTLLTKSPFNSLRIPRLEATWGERVTYINITRDPTATAESMRRNHFEFSHDGNPMTAETACRFYTSAVRRHAPAERTINVTHADLINRPHALIDEILDCLQLASLRTHE